MNLAKTALASLTAALVAAGCAPREADYDLSERAAAAPDPSLVPTARFDAPIQEGADAAFRLEGERSALAARAEALRARGAAMSAGDVVEPGARDRLGAAVPAPGASVSPAR